METLAGGKAGQGVQDVGIQVGEVTARLKVHDWKF